MTLAASVVAIATLAAAGAQASTLYSAAGVQTTQIVNTDYTIGFNAQQGAGQLSFTLDGYSSLDGQNWYEDDFTLLVNNTAILTGTWNLGGGGNDVVFSNLNGLTIENISGNGTNITWNGGHVNISGQIGLIDGANTITFAYNALAQDHAGWQDWGDEHWGVSDITVSAADRAPGLADGVPEPMTWALMVMGFGSLGAVLRRQRRLQRPVRVTA